MLVKKTTAFTKKNSKTNYQRVRDVAIIPANTA